MSRASLNRSKPTSKRRNGVRRTGRSSVMPSSGRIVLPFWRSTVERQQKTGFERQGLGASVVAEPGCVPAPITRPQPTQTAWARMI